MRILATLTLLAGLLAGGGIYATAQAYSCTTTCTSAACYTNCY